MKTGNEENHQLEWKEEWRDELLKWICGFANAHGGTLVIGKNDRGEVTGITNAARLMVEIPNKVVTILGIVVDVKLKSESNKEYIEIDVEAQPYPVSYKGEYHYRSGSTKQELKGQALDSFLLKKYGLHWDGVPHPRLKISNLDDQAFSLFVKKGLLSGRLDPSAENESKEQLLAKLKLTEGEHLKRAAALLFSDDPESFVAGAFVKIGFFKTDADLVYQDEIHGNIFSQVDRILDLLTTKYMKAYIRYKGAQRIDQFLFPPAALREAVSNAIVHKDYASANPVQISVYDEKIIIWNAARLAEELTIERLLGKHPSIPYNPLLASAFFRAGYIEAWGRGIEKIRTECLLAQTEEPEIKYDFGGVMVIFRGEIPSGKVEGEKSEKTTQETTRKRLVEGLVERLVEKGKESAEKVRRRYGESAEKWLVEGLVESQQEILKLTKENPYISKKQLSEIIGISTTAIDKNIRQLKKKDLLKRIGPDKGGHWEVVEKSHD